MLNPAILAFVLAGLTPQSQITKPTPAEIAAWDKDPNSKVLESAPCRKITWMLESDSSDNNPIRLGLGWWGRGFVEGAVYMVGDKAIKAASDFGLSVDVVAAHIKTYCYAHDDKTPFDAVQDLLLKVMKTAGPE